MRPSTSRTRSVNAGSGGARGDRSRRPRSSRGGGRPARAGAWRRRVVARVTRRENSASSYRTARGEATTVGVAPSSAGRYSCCATATSQDDDMASTGGIFISYRWGDAAGHAGRLYDRLLEHFGADQIFIDVEAIEPGVDLLARIEDAVGACEVLLAVIGPGWLAATHPDGRRRLHDAADIVRLEIAAALSRHVPVIPVLVGRAVMPPPDELPGPLLPLARHRATRIDDDRFHHDADRLIAALDRLLGAEPGAGQPATVACQRCRAETPAGARFCLACGAAVGEPPAGRREVRKTVTVVACAATVAAGPGGALDPESLRQVLGGYHGRTAEVVGRHGGTVAEVIGEAVMAVFGVPRLHEDDAVRAVRAAAELREAVAALDRRPPGRPRRPLRAAHRGRHRGGGGQRRRRPARRRRRCGQPRRPARARGRRPGRGPARGADLAAGPRRGHRGAGRAGRR